MPLNNMNLLQVKPDGSARIVDIGGGQNIRQKLNLQGIFEGRIVYVISTNGPITIEVDRNVVSIGRGMAQKIKVTRV
ncbi:MAG TPA: ferrous iron transport protein A [Methanosarcinaceae archaeon]|nr:ferrous iron transport protein A [Methanosarcinaceae archaeon]HJH31366.1 ferrous iron transport protein A [Methanosarcinaceae archaeon]